jgi:hypothetical protein
MKISRHGVSIHLGAVAICVAAVVSCASSGGSSGARADALAAAESSRKTQQQVQSELMAFADRFFAETLEVAKTLERTLHTPEGRYNAAGARLLALIVTADIAASPNPGGAVLDMCVYVTLKRMVWQEHWVPEVYGEDAGRKVLDMYRELEHDIWVIAASIYTPEQIDEVERLIDDWRSRHPDTVSVDFVRLAELGDARQVQNLMDAGRPGGMLAPVKEANRNIEEMRLLAERLTFMVTRMQLMVSLQVDMASTKLATQPEVRQLLEDSRTFAEVTDRAAEAFATLVADLPEERRAAIDQILTGLSEQREQIFADLGAEGGELRPALRDFRDTLETARELAAVLGETIREGDVLVGRMLEGDPEARPFDILEWQATLAEGAATAREIQVALQSIERILGSADSEDGMNPIIEGANRLEDEVVDEIIDRAFLRGVELIVLFFVVLALYRLLMRRLAPDLGPKRRPEQ